MLNRTLVAALALACAALPAAAAAPVTREFKASSGGTLTLDLETGGSVSIAGTEGSSVSVTYTLSCSPECAIEFDESGGGVGIRTSYERHRNDSQSDVSLDIRVPRSFDVTIDSKGGEISIDGVEGEFDGKTMGGALTLHGLKGVARLTTMGGAIRLTDSNVDGVLKTMGGEVTFENVEGDVQGRSMGGNVRYKNVRRRDGGLAAPNRLVEGVEDASPESVQISTMGGAIEIEDAPEGADLHTMGGTISVANARRFVRAKTMGGDVEIASVDGWVQATTMSGDIHVTVTGKGGDVTLTSYSGDVVLDVPRGFGMDLDLEIAYTRNTGHDYTIDAPGGLRPTVTPDWDRDHGSPRKYIRAKGAVGGGGNRVTIRTINGNIKIAE